ncbi:MAG: iron-siderophore ABC transporter substrate-binding protein [Scytonema sp. PMC 1069.18]|nr:iron-siderophore ABC transporter substrate-binding protein [Scytonema sp. PMC 1069.18]MEC4880342.1 iron-siderophore ABC transporter substrate-binding protein [Scytonema sp. PMC 1070.18]
MKQLAAECLVVQHMLGETCIPRNPHRIVTLWPNILGNTLALNVKPVASTYYTAQILPELHDQGDGIEFVGNITEPNLEKILLLKPDLILANSKLQNIYEQLSYIAPTVIMDLPFPPPPWKQQLIELANVLGKKEAANSLIDEYWQRIEKLQQALGDRRRQMQVSVATVSLNHGIYAYGQNHPVGRVLNDLRIQRPPAQRRDFYYLSNISEEHLSDIDGDVLFFLYWRGKDAKEVLEKFQQKPLWRQLKAVQHNQVYFVNAAYWHETDILSINAVIDDLFKYLVNTP